MKRADDTARCDQTIWLLPLETKVHMYVHVSVNKKHGLGKCIWQRHYCK
jgi:hypothetical protein